METQDVRESQTPRGARVPRLQILTCFKVGIWVVGFPSTPIQPVGASPARPSFCVLCCSSHLLSQPKDVQLFTPEGIPRHACCTGLDSWGRGQIRFVQSAQRKGVPTYQSATEYFLAEEEAPFPSLHLGLPCWYLGASEGRGKLTPHSVYTVSD